jgi:hypothetical protein
MAEDINRFIAVQANKLSNTTGQLGRKGQSFTTLPSFTQDVIEIWDCRRTEYSQDEGSVFVVGHPDYSKIGPSTLSGTYPIGPNTSATTLLSVTNAHNYFPEFFENDRFIDDSVSTGSFYEDDYYYLLGTEDIYQTTYIAFEDKIYKSLKVNLNSTYISSGSNANSDISIKGIINGSEYTLTNNSTTNLNNFSTDGVKIKLENIGSENIKLNNFYIKYN